MRRNVAAGSSDLTPRAFDHGVERRLAVTISVEN
jgi:hypothetical protein